MLERLFTSKTRIKVLQCLLFSTEKYRMRELSRHLKLPVSAVSRELNNLQKISLISKDKDFYFINENSNLVAELRSIFLKTDSFKNVLEKSLKGKEIDFALIFGSFASEKYTAESDIDLLIVGNVSNEEVINSLVSLEKRLSREINPVVWSKKHLKEKKDSSFVKDILKKDFI